MSPSLDPETLEMAHRVFDMARGGDVDRLGPLLEAGLPPNLTNSSGDTLLILAAYHDEPAAVAALLRAGADVSRANDRGQSALSAAVFRRSEPVVRALLGAGADPDGGSPSARETASFFELDEMTALLPPPGGGGVVVQSGDQAAAAVRVHFLPAPFAS